MAVGGRAAGLFDQERHRVGLVHQAQLARLLRLALVPRIEEHAAAGQDAVHIGHHRRHPAHVEVLAARAFLAGQAFVDVLAHGRGPVTHVRHVDGKFLGVFRNLHVRLGQHEAAGLAVQREHMYAVAHGQHQRGLRAVHGIAGRHLVRARLQEVVLRHGLARLGHVQHREDRADRHVHVDIRRAVERIEQQQVLTLRVAVRDLVERVHFLRGHRRQVAAPLVGVEQHFIGDDVQLLLGLALHIAGAGRAEHAREGALAHGVGNGLAGARHHLDQQPELRLDRVVLALLLDQVAGEADASHGWFSLDGRNSTCPARAGRVAVVRDRTKGGVAGPPCLFFRSGSPVRRRAPCRRSRARRATACCWRPRAPARHACGRAGSVRTSASGPSRAPGARPPAG
ncbi:hypothetical protein D3C72_981990 [compost metagenome]